MVIYHPLKTETKELSSRHEQQKQVCDNVGKIFKLEAR